MFAADFKQKFSSKFSNKFTKDGREASFIANAYTDLYGGLHVASHTIMPFPKGQKGGLLFVHQCDGKDGDKRIDGFYHTMAMKGWRHNNSINEVFPMGASSHILCFDIDIKLLKGSYWPGTDFDGPDDMNCVIPFLEPIEKALDFAFGREILSKEMIVMCRGAEIPPGKDFLKTGIHVFFPNIFLEKKHIVDINMLAGSLASKESFIFSHGENNEFKATLMEMKEKAHKFEGSDDVIFFSGMQLCFDGDLKGLKLACSCKGYTCRAEDEGHENCSSRAHYTDRYRVVFKNQLEHFQTKEFWDRERDENLRKWFEATAELKEELIPSYESGIDDEKIALREEILRTLSVAIDRGEPLKFVGSVPSYAGSSNRRKRQEKEIKDEKIKIFMETFIVQSIFDNGRVFAKGKMEEIMENAKLTVSGKRYCCQFASGFSPCLFCTKQEGEHLCIHDSNRTAIYFQGDIVYFECIYLKKRMMFYTNNSILKEKFGLSSKRSRVFAQYSNDGALSQGFEEYLIKCIDQVDRNTDGTLSLHQVLSEPKIC